MYSLLGLPKNNFYIFHYPILIDGILFDSNSYKNPKLYPRLPACKKLKDHWWWWWCIQHAPRRGCNRSGINGNMRNCFDLKKEDDFGFLKKTTIGNFVYVSWTKQCTSWLQSNSSCLLHAKLSSAKTVEQKLLGRRLRRVPGSPDYFADTIHV